MACQTREFQQGGSLYDAVLQVGKFMFDICCAGIINSFKSIFSKVQIYQQLLSTVDSADTLLVLCRLFIGMVYVALFQRNAELFLKGLTD